MYISIDQIDLIDIDCVGSFYMNFCVRLREVFGNK